MSGTMTNLWKGIWSCICCLLIFLEIVNALSACSQPGDCLSGFFCHTGISECMSCAKCDRARKNIQLCEKECFPVPIADPKTNTPTFVIALVVIVTLLVVGAVVAAAIMARRCRHRKPMNTAVQEVGEPQPVRIDPTLLLPVPEMVLCTMPDRRPLLDDANPQP